MQLIKYTRPCSYDFEPYLTLWLFQEDGNKELYVQISVDQEHPQWVRVGNLLEAGLLQIIKE